MHPKEFRIESNVTPNYRVGIVPVLNNRIKLDKPAIVVEVINIDTSDLEYVDEQKSIIMAATRAYGAGIMSMVGIDLNALHMEPGMHELKGIIPIKPTTIPVYGAWDQYEQLYAADPSFTDFGDVAQMFYMVFHKRHEPVFQITVRVTDAGDNSDLGSHVFQVPTEDMNDWHQSLYDQMAAGFVVDYPEWEFAISDFGIGIEPITDNVNFEITDIQYFPDTRKHYAVILEKM